MDLRKLTAAGLAAKIKAKEVSVMQAVQTVFDVMEEREGLYHCYVTVDREAVLKKAEEIQRRIGSGELTGPLAGVPVAVKDNLCTKGLLTTCSSKILGNFIPTYTAEAVRNLEKAGALVIGKTNMDEFAMGSTREPPLTALRAIHGMRTGFRADLPADRRRRWRRKNALPPLVPIRAVPSASRHLSAGWWA